MAVADRCPGTPLGRVQTAGKDLVRDLLCLEGCAVQSKDKLELHGQRTGQEMPLGRHRAALLMGAKMCMSIKGQEARKHRRF